MRSTKDDRQSRIARCVSVIAQIRRSRASDDLESLSDAELIEDLAEALTDVPDERRLIACAFALKSDVFGREIDPVCKLLEEIGITDFDPQQLIEARRSTYFEDFQRALEELDRDCEPEQIVRILSPAPASDRIDPLPNGIRSRHSGLRYSPIRSDPSGT
jgi:hypothetical protein